jgi:hypothetical protein
MERFGTKLPGAIGILNVEDNQTTTTQQDLKRIDIQIVWHVAEVDPTGQVVFENGQPKVKQIERQVSADAANKKVAPAIQSSGKALFINRLSEYHTAE